MPKQRKISKLKVKSGDILEFTAISWEMPDWGKDHPCVLISPITRYSEDRTDPEKMIEDICIKLCYKEVENYEIDEDLKMCDTSLEILRRVINERLAGKPTWEDKIRKVVKQRVQFYMQKYGDEDILFFKELKTINA